VALLASVANGLVWLVGVAVIAYLAVAQSSDGLFCTGGSVAAGVAVIWVLSAVALLAHRLLYPKTAPSSTHS
jgi:predicted membrane channel-forming protein YqfA (hemolysin III family)